MEDILKAHGYQLSDEALFHHLAEFKKLKDDACREVCKKALMKHYRQLAVTDNLKPLQMDLTLSITGKEAFQKEERGHDRWFITISAKDGINFIQFLRQMDKATKKQALTKVGDAYYVLEQRSEQDQEPYGFHIHWLLQTNTKTQKGKLVQQVYQCFTKYLAGANYVDVRPVHGDDAWSQKLSYIQGNKCADKMLKCQKDKVVRRKYNILDLYKY